MPNAATPALSSLARPIGPTVERDASSLVEQIALLGCPEITLCLEHGHVRVHTFRPVFADGTGPTVEHALTSLLSDLAIRIAQEAAKHEALKDAPCGQTFSRLVDGATVACTLPLGHDGAHLWTEHPAEAERPRLPESRL